MCSIDLKDAYYCINVREDYRKFLKFTWDNELYQFRTLGQGLGCSPRIFTKLMKVPMSFLRTCGIVIIAYIDDILIIAESHEQCLEDSNKLLPSSKV